MKERNKSTFVIGFVILAAAAVAAAGSRSFLGACVHEDGSFGSCHWAAQAVFGTALLMAAQSASCLLQMDASARKGIFLSMVFTAILGILLPGPLIGLCGMATMSCRALMRPAMTVLFALMGILSAAGVFLERNGITKDRER